MSIKVDEPVTVKPEYKGERLDHSSSKERLLCRRCSRLASHRAIKHVFNGVTTFPTEAAYCDFHVNEAIKYDDVRQVRELPEYRRHVKRLRLWSAQQHDAGTQEEML